MLNSRGCHGHVRVECFEPPGHLCKLHHLGQFSNVKKIHIVHLFHTSCFLEAVAFTPFAEQFIGEHIFNAKICFRALGMNQALNLIYPAFPLLICGENDRVEVIVIGKDPKRVMVLAAWTLGRWGIWESGWVSIDIWSKLLLYL